MELESRTLETALSEMHRRDGAEIGAWFGCALPDHFGDWQAEYRCLRESAGVLDKNYRAYLKFSGPDRVRYLNAILTNDIKGLKENHGTVSLFLNPQGHIQAEIETHALADKLFCVSYAMIRQPLIEGLEKYIIMDDVTLSDRTDEIGTLALEGPKAGTAVKELTGVDLRELGELESREGSVSGIQCRIVRRTPGKEPSAEFLVRREELGKLWAILLEATKRQGGGATGYRALNTVRLEAGIPWFGYDFGEKQIPHEAGLQDSHISYSKGCYTGQEIVERVRSRGQVNRARVSLKFDTKAGPARGTPLLADGKEVGFVTRTGFSPEAKAWIGMGYVRREKKAAGNTLEMAKGKATVITAPITGGD